MVSIHKKAVTTGGNSTSVGKNSLITATTGGTNDAFGVIALEALTTADYNAAFGYGSLKRVTTGDRNIGHGINSGENITTGENNTCLGVDAGGALSTGSNNALIGYAAVPTSSSVSNEFTLGNSSVATLRCNVQTISSLSDARDKTNVIDLPEGLGFINKLRPVKFEWATRDGNGKDGSYEHGFIAQDLQKAVYDFTGSNTALSAVYKQNFTDKEQDKYKEEELGHVDMVKLVPVLVKSIQELSAKVKLLQARVDEMEEI